jgi:hypothetical protein
VRWCSTLEIDYDRSASMQGPAPMKMTPGVERALDELEQLEPSDSALELIDWLLEESKSRDENVRFDQILSRLAKETNDARFRRASMLHALKCFAFQPALTRALAGLAEGSSDASVERLTAARAAAQLSRPPEAKRHLEDLVRAGVDPSQTLLSVATMCGLFELALDTAEKLATNGHPVPPFVLERVKTALINQRPESVCHEIKLISLGPNCLSWFLFNRWGLRSHLDEDWWRMPFNLAAWTKSSVIDALEDRFESLRDLERYQLTNSPRGLRLPVHRGYGVLFNHEGFFPGQLDEEAALRAVIDEYSQRAANFFDHGCRGRRLYLYYLERGVDLERLLRVLEALAHDDDYLLLVLDECEDPNWQRERPASHGRLLIRPVKRPNSQPNEDQSNAGHGFQRVLAESVLDSMHRVAAETGDNSPE